MLIASPNVGLDRTLEIEELRPGEVLRFSRATVTAGGKGVNVARVAKALGAPATLAGFAAGHCGRAVAGLLGDEGVPFVPVAASGEARSMAIILEVSGRVTVLNEPGPAISAHEWQAFERAVGAHLAGHRVLVCIGSVPPGSPPDAYARLVRLAHAAGRQAVVDANGALLAAALDAHPDVVTPNVYEAQALLTGQGDEPVEGADHEAIRRQAIAAAARLVERGARAAIVTAGATGAALVEAAEARGNGAQLPARWIVPPRVPARNPVGAGDAFAAGLVAALERGARRAEAVVEATATAAASVETLLPGQVDPQRTHALLHQMKANAADEERRLERRT